jgi:hypothetical protein
MQEIHQGSDMILKCLFTRYDEDVFTLLRTTPFSPLMGGDAPLTRGSQMYGRFTFPLVVQNQFFGTANALPGDLPGYRFANAMYLNSIPNGGGTAGAKLGIVFRCVSAYVPQTRSFICYTNVASQISGLTPN